MNHVQHLAAHLDFFFFFSPFSWRSVFHLRHVSPSPFNLAPFQPPLFTFHVPPNKAQPLIKTYCSLHMKDSTVKKKTQPKLKGKLLITLISLVPGSRQGCEVWTFISNPPVCTSDVLPGQSPEFVCSISKRLWRWGFGSRLGVAFFWGFFSTPGQFSSTFVLVWFVEHVVYGEGLYFLDFDELQIKEDQMNGHVTGGYTLCRAVVQRFGESSACTIAHTHNHMQMHEFSSSSCRLTGALVLIRLNYPARTGSVQQLRCDVSLCLFRDTHILF